MNYSEALDQQVAAWRWAQTDQARRFCERLFGGVEPFRNGEFVRTLIVEHLRYGEPFWVDAPICGLLQDSTEGLPPFTLRSSDLPAQRGFVWFTRPLPLPVMHDPDGKPAEAALHALSWAARAEMMSVVFYGPLRLPGEGRWSPLLAWAAWHWRFGQTHTEASDEGADAHGDMPFRHRRMEYVAALFAFLSQRIVVTPREQAERHAAKRIAREGWPQAPLIRVVQLRRTEHHGSRPREESEPVDWSCQWVVRGHWRQQYFPAKQEHRPLWITPHVKGPEDKPLKAPRATVFAVVR